MGLFDINMPLLYGEGQKAFLRLQGEIVNSSCDLSLFAWEAPSRYLGQQQFFGIFAPEYDYCEGCNTLVAQNNQFHNLNNLVITNKESVRPAIMVSQREGLDEITYTSVNQDRS